MIDPYDFVRGVTMSMATLWTVLGLRRSVRFVRRWETRLEPLGISRRWIRRQVVLTILRTTVLDPVNLALMLLLVGIWGLRSLL